MRKTDFLNREVSQSICFRESPGSNKEEGLPENSVWRQEVVQGLGQVQSEIAWAGAVAVYEQGQGGPKDGDW